MFDGFGRHQFLVLAHDADDDRQPHGHEHDVDQGVASDAERQTNADEHHHGLQQIARAPEK